MNCFRCRYFLISFSCLGVCSERPDPGGAERMNQPQITLYVRAGVMNTGYVLWMQESQALTSYNPPHHLNSHLLHTEGWRQDKKITIELFCEQEPSFVCVCECVCFYYYIPSTALCFSRHKPTNCISRYSSQTLGLVVYDQKPISAGSNEKKKKESGQSSGEI